MSIFEHTGPKAQVHLKNIEVPIWFSQVRDAIAYMRLPEETLETVAIYVNDMGKAQNWDFPEDNTWINVNDAFFVINSKKSGGMGAPEAVPFGTHDQANIFTSKYGGEIVKLNDIPDDYILAPVDLSTYEMEKAGEVK
jgi:copper chaperone NosL